MTWTTQRLIGTAGELHSREVSAEDAGSIWLLEAANPALVLGSSQSREVVDLDALRASGIEVVKRRSGGGAVLVDGSMTWIDVVIARDDPRWVDDLTRSFDWLGEAWVQVLGALGISDAELNLGPMIGTEWSKLVCFGGLGPGEVTVGGKKLVGMSQRRTRELARFQCAVLHRWHFDELIGLLDLMPEQRTAALVALRDSAVSLEDLGMVGVSALGLCDELCRVLSRPL